MSPRDVFDTAYVRVLRALNAPLDQAHADECWRAVKYSPASMFDAAASRLIATCMWPPKVAEWMRAVSSVRAEHDQERLRAQEAEAAARRAEQVFHCGVCLDTGLERRWCTDAAPCSCCAKRSRRLYDHPYVRPCTCRDDNPVWIAEVNRKREAAGRRRAAEHKSEAA